LQLSGIRKSFNIGSPVEVEILHGIDLRLEHGAFCALIGPSGSGKSTLLNIIGLLDRQSTGRLAIGGKDTQGLAVAPDRGDEARSRAALSGWAAAVRNRYADLRPRAPQVLARWPSRASSLSPRRLVGQQIRK